MLFMAHSPITLAQNAIARSPSDLSSRPHFCIRRLNSQRPPQSHSLHSLAALIHRRHNGIPYPLTDIRPNRNIVTALMHKRTPQTHLTQLHQLQGLIQKLVFVAVDMCRRDLDSSLRDSGIQPSTPREAFLGGGRGVGAGVLRDVDTEGGVTGERPEGANEDGSAEKRRRERLLDLVVEYYFRVEGVSRAQQETKPDISQGNAYLKQLVRRPIDMPLVRAQRASLKGTSVLG